MEKLVAQQEPVFADDALIQIANQAEARIDAVVKIKQVALKVTNVDDWVDQQGKPYLMASGSEKIANLFNISWRIDEPAIDKETDPDGKEFITYTYKGEFSLGGRTIEVEGSRSSRDEFFKKYIWENGKKTGEKPLDRRDLKMAALTNLLGNGITRILGIRNLTYEDLDKFAGIKKENVKGIQYKEQGEKKEHKQPQSRSDQAKHEIKDPDAPVTEPQLKAINTLYKKAGYDEKLIHEYCSEKVFEDGIVIESLKSLTKGQASKIIDALNVEVNSKNA